MRLIDDNDLVTIDLPDDGGWVRVKRQLSKADRNYITGAPFRAGRKLRQGTDGLAMEMEVVAGAIDMAKAEVCIKEWSLDATVTRENIAKLDEESFDYIVARLDELYPGPRGEEEKNDSSGSGPTSPPETEAPLPPS